MHYGITEINKRKENPKLPFKSVYLGGSAGKSVIWVGIKMRIKKIVASIVATAFAFQNIISVNAVTPEDIGFEYDSTRYSVQSVYFSGKKDGKCVYYNHNLIGVSYIDVIKVRRKNDGTVKRDAYMVRVTNSPKQTCDESDRRYYGGVNQLCKARITLLSCQNSLSYAPVPSAPTSSRSMSSGVDLGISKDGVSASYSLGFTAEYEDTAYQILAHDYKSSMEVEYDYLPTTKRDAAAKKKNMWLTNSHSAYFIFNFTNDTSKLSALDFKKNFIDYEFGYKCYISDTKNWNGDGLNLKGIENSNQYFCGAYSYK